VALGWGLWEGPARFYFWPLISTTNQHSAISNRCSIAIDFRTKWHNIRLVRQAPEFFRLRKNGGASDDRVRFATVGAYLSRTLWRFFAF
jgi:hypothetical protein